MLRIAKIVAARPRVFIYCFILTVLSCMAAPAEDRGEAESARHFAQRFYSWYTPKATQNDFGLPWKAALEAKDFPLSAELASALAEDIAAQEKVEGEIVGLDFDPFLYTQDACERYDAGKAIATGASYRVPVDAVCAGTKDERPDVDLEVVRLGGRWTIVNVHYPEARDLRYILRSLQADRASNQPEAP